jgi:hypothetical protein
MERLLEMIERAYKLSVQAQEEKIDIALAEEVSGECAELLAYLNRDYGAFGDDECKDQELIELSNKLLIAED